MYKSQTLALIAAVAVAQKGWKLEPMNVGGDVNSDSTIVNAAAYCMGTDGFNSGDEFFVGVAEVEGETANYVIGWGKQFCGDGYAADTDADYTITFSYAAGDGSPTTSDTGLTISCPSSKSAATTTWKNLEAQVDDKKAMSALKGVKKEVLDGDTVLIDSLMTSQGSVRTDTENLLATMVTDGQAFLDDMDQTASDWITQMVTDATVTRDAEYDAYILGVISEIYETIVAQAENSLTADEFALIESDGGASLDAVLAAFASSFENIKQSMYTALDSLATEGESDIQDIINELKGDWDSETAKIETVVDNTEILDQKTLDKKIVPRMERLQKKLDNKLNKVNNGTKKVARDFVKATKDSINDELPNAEEAVGAALEDAETVLSAIMADNPSGKRKVLAAVYRTEKMVKTASKQVIKDITKVAKDISKEMVTDMNGEVKSRKQDSKTYLADTYTTADSFFNDVTPYPMSADATFSINDLNIAGTSVTATITRSSDSTTATCTLIAEADPRTDDCEYGAIDNLKYDYLCGMPAQDIKVQGVTVDCSDDFRPAAVWC